ncbi:DUF433 domain-containing protein [Mucilaginibacter sp.]
MAQVNYKEYIEVDPEIRFGKPVIKGTRITLYDVFTMACIRIKPPGNNK